MKAKSGAGKVITHSLAKIQMLCNAKYKSLRTDGAKDQDAKELKTFLDDSCAQTLHTAPNASQSNAIAERRFRQLMAEDRSEIAAAPRTPKRFWSHAVSDAAKKGNYMATAKDGKSGLSPYGKKKGFVLVRRYQLKLLYCLGVQKENNISSLYSAVKVKMRLENRAEDALYLRRKSTDIYQVWFPHSNKVTTTRITDFIVPSINRKTDESKHCDGEQAIVNNEQAAQSDEKELASYEKPSDDKQYTEVIQSNKVRESVWIAGRRRSKHKVLLQRLTSKKRKKIIADSHGSNSLAMVARDMPMERNDT